VYSTRYTGLFFFIQNSLLKQNCVIPAQAGIQQEHRSREADKTATTLTRFAGDLLIILIPACAGMTD
jgi:hypothetical protein